MSTRNKKYLITIRFEKSGCRTKYEAEIPYLSGGKYKDFIKVENDTITIIASRSTKIILEEIFYNNSSAIYLQILKALIFYYTVCGVFHRIKNITVSYSSPSKEPPETLEKTEDELTQIFTSACKLKYRIPIDNASLLFNEDKKGKALKIILSFLLLSNNSNSVSDRFNLLWRGFNHAFSVTELQSDRAQLDELFVFIRSNEKEFHKTRLLIEKNGVNLLNKIRVRAYILDVINKAHKKKKDKKLNKEFINFSEKSVEGKILLYKDKNINIIFKSRINKIKPSAFSDEFLTKIVKYFDNNIDVENSDDVFLFLLFNYMYFVRNKIFHGSNLDSRFRLSENKETNELNALSDMLECLLVDSINCFDTYYDFYN